jgi:RimJ/RimL family protein N-acetyltransferase
VITIPKQRITGIPTIITPRLSLRPFALQDAAPLHRVLGGKDVLRYFPNPDPPPLNRVQKMIADQLEHWEKHGYGWWALDHRATNALIGWCGLQFLPETEETEVGYLLDRPFWGQGLATEAARVGLQYGFEDSGLETIVAIVHPENVGSQRVIEKLGMSFTGRAHYFGMDCYRYSMRHASCQLPRRKRRGLPLTCSDVAIGNHTL